MLSMPEPLSQSDAFSDAISYIATGRHAFIAIDEHETRNRFAVLLDARLKGQPFAVIDGRESESGRAFSEKQVSACNSLVLAIGEKTALRSLTVSGYLQDAMLLFQTCEKQGFLMFNHIDPMIGSQGTFEIGGALRSAMERHDDIAVVLCGSKTTIVKMCQDDRPFYCSFRTFLYGSDS
jgi:hypothetical protein